MVEGEGADRQCSVDKARYLWIGIVTIDDSNVLHRLQLLLPVTDVV
jgi:hypothetical protein